MINYTSLHFLSKNVYGKPFRLIFIIDNILQVGYICTMRGAEVDTFQVYYTTNDDAGEVDSFMTHNAYELETVRNIWKFLKRSGYQEDLDITVDFGTIKHAEQPHQGTFYRQL